MPNPRSNRKAPLLFPLGRGWRQAPGEGLEDSKLPSQGSGFYFVPYIRSPASPRPGMM